MSYTQIKRLLNEIKELKEENQLLKHIIIECLETYGIERDKMLFKKEHVEMIKNGTKTQTRRVWKKRMVKKNGIYKVKTNMLSKDHHCKIKVLHVGEDCLYNMGPDDFIAEGYTNANEFWKVWEEINGNTDNMKVTVVTFELVKN